MFPLLDHPFSAANKQKKYTPPLIVTLLTKKFCLYSPKFIITQTFTQTKVILQIVTKF